MPPDDRKHFEIFREQTRIKHAILQKYLPAFFHILGTRHPRLLYVDAFAGRGDYSDGDQTVPGSPLHVLNLIAKTPKFAASVKTYFTEPDPELFEKLSAAVDAFCKSHPEVQRPIMQEKPFREGTEDLFAYLAEEGGRLPPTFLFVDPCGVNGADLGSIGRYAAEQSEVFLFFNYDGINRIAGLRDRARGTLSELLGSDEARDRLIAALEACDTPAERENCILTFYLDLLRDQQGWTYTCPFRIEMEGRRSTSHYLIHATKHPLGFRLMKEVMWPLGHSETGGGGLTFVQASRDPLPRLFELPDNGPREQILEVLRALNPPAKLFYETLSEQAGNFFCVRDYRPALVRLEAEGLIEVWDPKSQSLAPAATRQKRNGEATLAERLVVRLREAENSE